MSFVRVYKYIYSVDVMALEGNKEKRGKSCRKEILVWFIRELRSGGKREKGREAIMGCWNLDFFPLVLVIYFNSPNKPIRKGQVVQLKNFNFYLKYEKL